LSSNGQRLQREQAFPAHQTQDAVTADADVVRAQRRRPPPNVAAGLTNSGGVVRDLAAVVFWPPAEGLIEAVESTAVNTSSTGCPICSQCRA
jgi:hypothetical protein